MKLQITISHIRGINNGIPDSLSRLALGGDYMLKIHYFHLACHHLHTTPTIDLFAQDHNHLMERYLRADALAYSWIGEIPWIHCPIALLPRVINKRRTEKIICLIVAPMWPGQTWYTELITTCTHFLILGLCKEILIPGPTMLSRGLKLPPGALGCFLMGQ
jgi:hypothetical protein